MKKFYSCLEKNAKWETEMDLIKQYSNMVEEGDIISKGSCYYPRFTNTKKRGRVAFIEIYKQICCEGKTKQMSIEDFELFVCKHKQWDVHITPTDKHGKLCAEWILQTESNENVLKYVCEYEYLMTPELPSISTKEDKIDNISAIKNLASNLDITGEEAIQLIKYFLGGLEQLSSLGGSP